jgi:hypothetical protein
MASTSKGIVYPTSGDNIAPLETHFSALAGSVNSAILLIDADMTQNSDDIQTLRDDVGVIPQSGSFSFTSPTTTATAIPLTINFPVALAAAPAVVATVGSATAAGAYIANVHNITSSQFQARVWRISENANLGAATITIATPAVITRAAHELIDGNKIYFTTTGALPTGILAGTVTTNNYFVRNVTANTFNISSTLTGALINTSGTQSGVHTLRFAAQETLALNWIAK